MKSRCLMNSLARYRLIQRRALALLTPIFHRRGPGKRLIIKLALLPLLLVLTMTSCGPKAPRLVEASGKVTLKGEPLTAGAIYFSPADTNEFRDDQPSSLLQLDGSFRMQTFPFGDGVTPGQYQVTLAPALASRIGQTDLADPKKTPWKVVIPEQGVRDLLFAVP